MKKNIKVKTIDLHAAGEPCRVIYEHFFDVPGATMYEKRDFIAQNFDDIRRALMLEPRGHTNMFGSVMTRPVSQDADLGVLFLTNAGFMDMCIHGSICTSRAVVELGFQTKHKDKLVFDTLSGKIKAHLIRNEEGDVTEVEIQNVPAFAYGEPVMVPLEGLGEVRADIVFAGNFFAIVDGTDNEKLNVCTEKYEYLTRLGMDIKDYVNEHVKVEHPQHPELNLVKLAIIFNRKGTDPKHIKQVVVFGNNQIDRSPCGTGTSGMMVYFKERDELEIGEHYVSESIIGSIFYGHLKEQTEVEGLRAFIPCVKGHPAIMSIAEFWLEQDDIYQAGIPMIL